MDHSQTISLYQPVLYSIALKMVRSLDDAEDIVQETFLKWLTIDQKKIRDTKAYLIRAVTNNCLNHLNSLKKKKEELFSAVNLEMITGKYKEPDLNRVDQDSQISIALEVIHKKLKPMERAVYLLREVFELEYENIQEIFDKSQANCRQLLCRAKEKLRLENKNGSLIHSNTPNQFIDSFTKASKLGHLSDLIKDLKQDILPKFGKSK